MLKRIVSVLLVVLVAAPLQQISAANLIAFRDSASRTEKVKAGIAKLGVGPEAQVHLKLKDKTRLSGYISAVDEESFVVTDAVSGSTTTVEYPNVTQVQGNNLTTRTKVIIAASIIAGVIITLYLVRGAFCDGC